MKRTALILTLVGATSVMTSSLAAQAPKPPQKQPLLEIAAVAGCLTQEGNDWFVTAATGPLKTMPAPPPPPKEGAPPVPAPEPGAKPPEPTAEAVTAEFAAKQPAGKERYRLMGLVNELSVPQFKGQKVLVRGFVLSDAKGKRINPTAVMSAAPTCK